MGSFSFIDPCCHLRLRNPFVQNTIKKTIRFRRSRVWFHLSANLKWYSFRQVDKSDIIGRSASHRVTLAVHGIPYSILAKSNGQINPSVQWRAEKCIEVMSSITHLIDAWLFLTEISDFQTQTRTDISKHSDAHTEQWQPHRAYTHRCTLRSERRKHTNTRAPHHWNE